MWKGYLRALDILNAKYQEEKMQQTKSASETGTCRRVPEIFETVSGGQIPILEIFFSGSGDFRKGAERRLTYKSWVMEIEICIYLTVHIVAP